MESFYTILSLFRAMSNDELKLWCDAFSLVVSDGRDEKIAALMGGVDFDDLKQRFTKDFLDEFCRDHGIPSFSKLTKDPLFEHIKMQIVDDKMAIKQYAGPPRRMSRPSGRPGGRRKVRTITTTTTVVEEELGSYFDDDNASASSSSASAVIAEERAPRNAARVLQLLSELVHLLQ